MARIGMKYPVAAKRTETGGVVQYTGGMVLAHAMSANITVVSNSAELYGDDAKQDEEIVVGGGTLSFGSTDIDYASMGLLFNHKINLAPDGAETVAELEASSADVPADVGFGFYSRTKYYNRQLKSLSPGYRAIWLLHAKFQEPSEENTTMSNSPAYSTPTVSGSFFVDDNGKWKEEAIFKTEQAARNWLNRKAGIVQ